MKTNIYISALLVVASTLLSSCELLVSSPIHHSRRLHHSVDYESGYYGGCSHRDAKVYKEKFEVSAEGGTFEFSCTDDNFYISRVFDSSMLYEPFSGHYSPATDDFIDVGDFTYSGSFYTITCNNDKHKWAITVDPIIATSGDLEYREIWMYMWDGSDDSHFLFRFEQMDDFSYEIIE